jgi:hypothetical protein
VSPTAVDVRATISMVGYRKAGAEEFLTIKNAFVGLG